MNFIQVLHIVLVLFGRINSSTLTVDGNFIVSPEEQVLGTNAELQKCNYSDFTERKQNPYRYGYCPRVFDKVMCWPPTPVNTTIQLPCPRYFNALYKFGFASRICLSNGSWAFNRSNYYPSCYPRNFHLRTLDIIGHTGYGISAVSLCVSLFFMIYFRRLHCTRNFIHMNLFIAFLLRLIISSLAKLQTVIEGTVYCRLINALQVFAIEASYTWVFVEALYLHNVILIHVMTEPSAYAIGYCLFGWAIPSMVTILWIVLRYIYDNEPCWLRHDDPWKRSFWLMTSFPLLTVILNLLLFVNIVRVLFMKMRAQNSASTTLFRRLAKSVMVLVFVFGIYYIFVIPFYLMDPATQEDNYMLNLVKTYYEHVMQSYQGFVVSFLFCLINSEVINEVKKVCQRYHLRRGTSEYLPPVTSTAGTGGHLPRRRTSTDPRRQHGVTSNEEIPLQEGKSGRGTGMAKQNSFSFDNTTNCRKSPDADSNALLESTTEHCIV